MTDRGLPSVDGPPACPFIAFEDERDERASSPDHRHRCYAEVQPAPRALAHQEAYCLSSAFPVCPTFQDWARREAAQARGSSVRGSSGAAATAASVAAQAATRPSAEIRPEEDDLGLQVDDPDHDDAAGGARRTPTSTTATAPTSGRSRAPDAEPLIRRNPPRDWAAPPPWASGSVGARVVRAADRRRRPLGPGIPGQPPGRGRRGAGLAGSAADRLASGQPRGHASVIAALGRAGRPRRRTRGTQRAARPPAPIARRRATIRRRPRRVAARPSARRAPRPRRPTTARRGSRRSATRRTRPSRPGRGCPASRGSPRSRRRSSSWRSSSSCCRASSAWVARDRAAPPAPTPGASEVVASDSPEPTVDRGPDAADLHDQGGRHAQQDRQEVRADGRAAARRQQADQEPEQDRGRATC